MAVLHLQPYALTCLLGKMLEALHHSCSKGCSMPLSHCSMSLLKMFFGVWLV